MDKRRFQEIVRSFAGRRLVVLGDLMTDEYLWGRATRISPESPVMVVEVDRETSVPGGAANVVNNLLALGAQVAVVGVIGDDPAGVDLKEALIAEGADVQGVVVDPSRPTTRKTRVVARSQQVLRVDREQTHPVPRDIASVLLDRLRAALHGADAVLVSDYNKGVMIPMVSQSVVSAARDRGILLTANAKPPNAHALAGAHLIQLNQAEAEATATIGDPARRSPRFGVEEEFETAGANLRGELNVGTLLVTRGTRGFTFWTADGRVSHVPPHLVEVYDEAGAGDTVLSALTLGLVSGGSLDEAGLLASRAAAAAVRKVGVATVTPDELLAELG